MGASYSKKRRQRSTLFEKTAVVSLSPSSHNEIGTSPVRSSSSLHQFPISTTPVEESPLKSSPIPISPSPRLKRSLSKSTRLDDINVFDVEDVGQKYIPSFKRKTTYQISRQEVPTKSPKRPKRLKRDPITTESEIHIDPITMQQDTELNSKFFIESTLKPIWSPSKLKSPVKISSFKQSSLLLPKRKLCFDPIEVQTSVKLPAKETDAWSLFNEVDLDHKPKLMTKSTPSIEHTQSSKDEVDASHDEVSHMYERLISTPRKAKLDFVEKRESPRSVPRSSPRGQKTYSLIRSFRADMDNEDEYPKLEDDVDDSEVQCVADIQDINQLRINGMNSKFNEEFEYLIEGLCQKDENLIRATVLEICLKIFKDEEFYQKLIVNGIPEVLLQSMLSATDTVVQFCFVVLCYKLRLNDQLINRLTGNSKEVHVLLKSLSQNDMNNMKLSKVSQHILSSLFDSLYEEFETKDTDFFYYLFLKTFKDNFKFDIKLVNLEKTGEELFINLSILEHILQENNEVPTPILQRLKDITLFEPSDELLRSCEMLALQSLILLSLSETTSFTTEFISALFCKLMANIDSSDPLTKNIVLLQLGLTLNLVDRFEPVGTEPQIISHLKLNREKEVNKHIYGYISLVFGNLNMMGKLELDEIQRNVLVESLHDFKEIAGDNDLMLQKIDGVLNFFGVT